MTDEEAREKFRRLSTCTLNQGQTQCHMITSSLVFGIYLQNAILQLEIINLVLKIGELGAGKFRLDCPSAEAYFVLLVSRRNLVNQIT
jgi:hypothetical protein